jgi:hypothetical protein
MIAGLKPANIANDQHKCQQCDRTNAGLRHQQTRLRMFSRRLSYRRV